MRSQLTFYEESIRQKRTFVRNHAQSILACDFLVVVTARFRTLYVFLLMEVGTRRIVHCNVTAHPTAAWTLQGSRLNHAASAQYRRVSPGDMLWIVTIRDHRFKLLGRLRVEKIVNQKEAELLLGKGIYEAELHALAVPDTVELASEIDIQDLAKILRFNSGRDRLALNDAGSVDGKQIQTLREVTSESARLLSETWSKRSPTHRVPPELVDAV